tara:strand:- start:245 stop:574 length:330 start_codon:yes stop_codon:yes gene_type:complete
MNDTFTRTTSRLAKHLAMAKLIDTNARVEEAREHLYECQMQHIEVDYREIMETNIDEADNKKIVEEIVENVFIIVTNMGSCEADIKEKISGNLTTYNGKMGFSNKSKFK